MSVTKQTHETYGSERLVAFTDAVMAEAASGGLLEDGSPAAVQARAEVEASSEPT